jgi:YhcH/YjgK/YiaL family protein
MIKGKEKIGVTDLTNCTTCVEYDSEKDLEFYEINCKEEYLNLNENEFLIFYPHDAHKPSISIEKPSTVKKVVVKVAVK